MSLPTPVTQSTSSPPVSQLSLLWTKFKRQIGSESVVDTLDYASETLEPEPAIRVLPLRQNSRDPVDIIVVENDKAYHLWSKQESPADLPVREREELAVPPPSLRRGNRDLNEKGITNAHDFRGVIDGAVSIWKGSVQPALRHFFAFKFEPELETNFQKEWWYSKKTTYIFASLFHILSMIFTLSMATPPSQVWTKVVNFGFTPILSLALLVMTVFNWPQTHKYTWQIVVWIITWTVAISLIIEISRCGRLSDNLAEACPGRHFLSAMYYATAFPILSLFGLGQTRLMFLIGMAFWIVTCCATLVDLSSGYIREVINWTIFQLFILFSQYLKEFHARKLFEMRAELKVELRARREAQLVEQKLLTANRDFVNSVFHEVRNPLNCATYAIQNLKGSNVISRDPDLRADYEGLQDSLELMKRVLNEVLDFAKLEAGRFSPVDNPFSFKNTMGSLLSTIKPLKAQRNLNIIGDFDERVDYVARYAAWGKQKGLPTGSFDRHPLVVGDEIRLRQVLGNLTSNAAKFTPPGGSVTVRTRLVYPELPPLKRMDTSPISLHPLEQSKALCSSTEEEFIEALSNLDPQTLKSIVVRLEVTDTGPGIKWEDLDKNKLFSPYSQTEIGKQQGVKGTGLGLYTVKQIVTNSGGKLGIKSTSGSGSGTTFWVEMSFGVGPETRNSEAKVLERMHKNFEMNEPSLATLGNPIEENRDYRFSDTIENATYGNRLREKFENGQQTFADVELGQLTRTTKPFQLTLPVNCRQSMPDLSEAENEDVCSSPTTPVATSFLSNARVPPRPPPARLPRPESLPGTPPAVNTSAPPFSFISTAFPFIASLPPGTLPRPPIAPKPAGLVKSWVASAASNSPSPPRSTPPPVPPHRPVGASRANSIATTSPRNSLSVDFSDLTLLTDPVSTPVLPPSPIVEFPPALPSPPSDPSQEPVSPTIPRPIRPPVAMTFANGKLSVLIVDDDALTRRLMGRMLTRLDCEVSEAENGAIALQKILGTETDPPTNFDIVFMDSQMPICSGLEAVKRLREAGKNTYTVGVTGNALLSDQQEFKAHGADDVLTKPVAELDIRKQLRIADDKKNP